MNFVRAVATVGGLTMASRVAGFVRDILTAAILGAGPAADAFFVALKLPNFFRRLFAEGAFSVSFVPLFSAELQANGRPAAERFAEQALAVMVTVLVPFTIAMIAAMPWAMGVLAPGFTDDPQKYGLAVDLARVTFPYLLLVSLVALLGGVLNSLDRFAPFAAAPIAFNLTLIAALLGARQFGWDPAQSMAWAVTLSGIVQLVWLAWACRIAGIRLQPRLPTLTPLVRRLFRLMGPGAIGAGVMQINLFVDIVLASLLGTGAVSYLYYADRLYQLPLGVIGIAIGTALLPVLARQVAAGDQDGVRHYLSRALEASLLLALPATVALIVIAEPIISTLFERGRFGATETAAVSTALAAYAIGIPAYILVKVFSSAFFARQDTASPVRVAVLTTVLNAVLAFTLIHVLGHVGIALATGLTAWVNAGLLAWGLWRRGGLTLDAQVRRRAPLIAGASLVMGVVLYALDKLTVDLQAGDLLSRVFGLGAMVMGGGAVFFGVAQMVGAVRASDLKAMLRRPKGAPAPEAVAE